MKASSLTPYLSRAQTSPPPSTEMMTHIIHDVLNDPSVFIFGELLDVVGVNSSPLYSLLQVFAFGTMGDLSREEVGRLSEGERRKLQLLTIVEMAKKKKILKYEELLKEVGMGGVRELEDLVIEGMDEGVFRGKMNQKEGWLVIHEVMGRDVEVGGEWKGGEGEVDRMIEVLGGWRERAKKVMEVTEKEVEFAQREKERDVERGVETKKKLDALSQTLLLAAEMSGDGGR